MHFMLEYQYALTNGCSYVVQGALNLTETTSIGLLYTLSGIVYLPFVQPILLPWQKNLYCIHDFANTGLVALSGG